MTNEEFGIKFDRMFAECCEQTGIAELCRTTHNAEKLETLMISVRNFTQGMLQ